MESDTTGEVTGTDHVDLVCGAGNHTNRMRIRHPLGDIGVATSTPRSAHPGALKDPFDGARWWDVGDTQTA